MRQRFDSRPLIIRRNYGGAVRRTVILHWRSQLGHGAHLFFVIAAAVIARNVANQRLLDSAGSAILGELYATVALVAGLTVAAVGWLARSRNPTEVARVVHATVALAILAAFFIPASAAGAIATYIAMEIAFVVMLYAFGVRLGVSLGPREARKTAGHVGAGGVLGGFAGGALLGGGELLVGSRGLLLAAALLAVAPVFWLRAAPPEEQGAAPRLPAGRRSTTLDTAPPPTLATYGRWVMVTTLVMVAATTLIDYQYRSWMGAHYTADQMTSMFGLQVLLANILTVVFQFTLLDRLLDRFGVFGTAAIMPSALFGCLLAFGVFPTLVALVALKTVDSGANMSLQQATGNLLLAPLAAKARAIWQGRIDGFAKRGGQGLMGLFLAFFPWSPTRVLPITLLLCLAWIGCLVATRRRYVRLLTELLGIGGKDAVEVCAYDGTTVRLLEQELATSAPGRAGVILDLLEQAGHRAPDAALQRLVEADPDGPGAQRVVEHLARLKDRMALSRLTARPEPELAAAALLALAELDPESAVPRSRQLLVDTKGPEALRAAAAGMMADRDPLALSLCLTFAVSARAPTRLALARALARSRPLAPAPITELLVSLARDDDARIAGTALGVLGRAPTPAACEVALASLGRRELRRVAMRTLAEMGRAVVDRIAAQLDRWHLDARAAETACWVLGHIGSSAAAPALLRALGSPVGPVRLSAAVALSSLKRRMTGPLPEREELLTVYLAEIRYYARMREATLAALPDTPAARLLERTLQQRCQASLETLFRLLSLRHQETTMRAAFSALSSNDNRQQQIALELLDNVLEPDVRDALTESVGAIGRGRRRRRSVESILPELAEDQDAILAGLARAVLIQRDHARGAPRRVLEVGDAMPQTTVDRILELQALPLFAYATAEDLAEVTALVSEREVAKGELLFREGDAGDGIYLIHSGEVTLTRRTEILAHLGPGATCGVLSVLDQLPREMTATVTKPARLSFLPGPDLIQLLADRPLMMHGVFRTLTDHVRNQLEAGEATARAGRVW